MIVRQIGIENFRNIEKMNIEPCDNVNVIFGENAQGKTNILESIWMFTGCRSFRGTKDKELIRFGEKEAKIDLSYYGSKRERTANITIGDRKIFSVGGVTFPSPSKGIGEFTAVVFSPVHLSLIKQGPAERRRFLDIAISQLKPNYASLLTEYTRAVAQRNVLLRDINFHSELYDMLDLWEERMAHYGAKIALYRLSYLEKLTQEVTEIYSGLSCGKEKIELKYIQSENENYSSKEEFITKLREKRKEDIRTGSSSFGIHRDDLEININGISARYFGSQGQQRSCALALKMGEAGVIKKLTDEQPVALLDDVMSELDVSRQDYILNHIKDWQVFITCCEPGTIQHLKQGRSFRIENGKVMSSL